MTAGEFANIVEEMRAAQKRYFSTRSSDSLKLSRELERQVDKILAERKTREYERQNPPLID